MRWKKDTQKVFSNITGAGRTSHRELLSSVHAPNILSSEGCARQKPEAWNSIWVSHMSKQEPKYSTGMQIQAHYQRAESKRLEQVMM